MAVESRFPFAFGLLTLKLAMKVNSLARVSSQRGGIMNKGALVGLRRSFLTEDKNSPEDVFHGIG